MLSKIIELSENGFYQSKRHPLNEVWGNVMCFLPWLMHISVS